MDISKAARRSSQSGEDKWKEPVQHQSLLHKKLYEKNALIQTNTKSFFEVKKDHEIENNEFLPSNVLEPVLKKF